MRRIVLLVVLVLGGAVIAALLTSRRLPVAAPFAGDPASLLGAYRDERSGWNATLFGADSPLAPADRDSFTGLSWFPPDPGFRFVGQAEHFPSGSTMQVADTKGGVRTYQRLARFRFRKDGETHALTIFRDEAGGLFVPFVDATSGSETYGGGRYVEAESLDVGTLAVDFNRAYNPYCAYDSRWSCPIPPEENRLTLAVRAGMRGFAH